MICPECLVDHKESDFFGKERCYKCIYKEKTKGISTKSKIVNCKVCGKPVPPERRKICSEKCAGHEMDVHNKSYWTRKIIFTKLSWY